MTTLLLDSADGATTVVVAEGPTVLGASVLKARPVGHLHLLIDRSLRDLDLSVADLDRIAAVTGPGSWIGIQAAVATAKTLAQVAGIPLVPLSRLDALAWTCRLHGHVVAALVDARNDLVYRGLYQVGPDDVPVPIGTPDKVDVGRVVDELAATSGPVVLVGSGAEAHDEPIRTALGPERAVTVAHVLAPHVEALAQLAEARATDALAGQAIYTVDPMYLLGETDALREHRP